MAISERIIELQKKWNDVNETMAVRIDPPVYSHPELVYDMACDLETTIGDLKDLADQLMNQAKKIVTTVEELNGLPIGSLILELESEPEKFAFPWVKVAVEDSPPLWSAPGDEQDYAADQVGLPAYVLWAPAE